MPTGTTPSGSTPIASPPGPIAPPTRGLRPVLRRRNAIALYVSSVLGSGILVLPGITGQIAGPGALIAWALLAGASLPFALTFAGLSARRPESGGIYGFAREAFGPRVATATGWLFALWTMTGAPAVALIAASYLGYAFPLSRPETYLLGFAVVASAVAVNYRGIVLSARVQLAVIGVIVALLAVTVLVSAPRVHAAEFTPFFPDGIAPVGTAAALIFWSFLGYENVSNVAEEFENPARDLPRSVFASVGVVGTLYFAVAFVTIGTGAFRAGGGVAPFAAILGNVFGPFGAAGTAVLALFVVFGVVNAYTTGMSRVVYATARDGGFPRALAHIDPSSRVPDRALLTLLGGISAVMGVYYLADVSLTEALLVASGAAIAVYVIGCAAGVRLRLPLAASRAARWAIPAVALGISLVVLPFIGLPLLVSGGVLLVAFAYATVRRVGSPGDAKPR